MISELAITFFAWLALVLISVNLIGMFVRGLASNPEIDSLALEGTDVVKKVAREHQSAERRMNVFAMILIIVYLIALFYFWNIGVAIAAITIMVVRIPALLWEIKHGRQNIKHLPAPYMLTIPAMFLAFPILWYALYRM